MPESLGALSRKKNTKVYLDSSLEILEARLERNIQTRTQLPALRLTKGNKVKSPFITK